jgi:hypothetical protein
LRCDVGDFGSDPRSHLRLLRASVPISVNLSSCFLWRFALAVATSIAYPGAVEDLRIVAVFSLALVCVAAAPPQQEEASVGGDRLSLCQSQKIEGIASNVSGLLRCYAEAAATTHAVDAGCVATQQARLVSVFAEVEKAGGCATVGDAPSVEQSVESSVERLVALAPGNRRCADTQLRKIATASNRLFTAFARQRKEPNAQTFGAVEYTLREKLRKDFSAREPEAKGCSAIGDEVFEVVFFTLPGEVIRQLWPMSVDGMTLDPPPGFTLDAWGFVISDGHLIDLANFDPTGRQFLTPPGGAEMLIHPEPAPGGLLSVYIDRQAHGRSVVSQSPVEVDHIVGTEVLSDEEFGHGMTQRWHVAYVLHRISLWRFSLVYGGGDPDEGAFTAAFERLLASVHFPRQLPRKAAADSPKTDRDAPPARLLPGPACTPGGPCAPVPLVPLPFE